MDIRSLRYVVTLSEEMHFGRAAGRHYISAQPFGRAVAHLERELGQPLFARTSRRVWLTPAGERFLPRARAVLAQLDDLARVSQAGPAAATHLTVGVLGFGLADRWPLVLDSFANLCPDTAVVYRELDLVDQYDAVRRGDVDVGVVQHVGPVDGLVLARVFSSPQVAVVPARSTLADADRLTLRDLDGAAWLGIEATHPGYVDWAGPAAHWTRQATAVRSPAAIPAAVATTGLIGLHADAARRYFPRPDVRFVPVDGPACDVAVAVREADDRPGVTAFCEATRLVMPDPG